MPMKTVLFEDLIQSLRSETVPFSVVWEMTNRCNLKCVHCYRGKGEHELGMAAVTAMLDDLASCGCLKLTLTGGEPTLRPDFTDIYAYCNKKGFAVTLFTNGTRFSQEVREALQDKPPYAVECSLHGATAEAHDSVTGVAGSFDATIRNIAWLLDNRFHVAIKSVMLAFNHHELKGLRDLTRQWGTVFQPTFRVFPILDPDRPETGLRVPDHVLAAQRSASPREDTDAGDEPDPNRGEFMCNAGRQACCISAEGKIYPCVALRWECGDLKERAFSEIWRDSGVLEMIRGYREEDFKQCFYCPWKHVCEFCPGMGYGEHGNMLIPSAELCRITKLTKTVPRGA
ncbi:MAG: radical SAM protein [Deltaproteobacteria bacterium]|nr:radical SAM protein [Deltaproteobacteria bacterium]